MIRARGVLTGGAVSGQEGPPITGNSGLASIIQPTTPADATPLAGTPLEPEQNLGGGELRTSRAEPYEFGDFTLQLLSGAYFAPTIYGRKTTAFDLLPQTVRLSWIANTPSDDQLLCRGCLEILLEDTVIPVAHGPGHVFTGPSALLRWDFVQPDARLIPYIQGGTGILWDDVAEHNPRSGIGGSIEFLLQTEFGVHYRLADDWALDVESGFVHISNGGTAKYNVGINAPGVSIGLTYYFNRR